MRKATLAMACLAILALVASCKKEPATPETPENPDAPTIALMTGAGYAGQDTELYGGDQITVGFNATGVKLVKIELNVTQDGNSIYSHSETINNLNTYSYTHTFTVDAVGTLTLTGTVTDATGQTGTTSFDILSIEKPNAKFIGHYEGDAYFNGNCTITPSIPIFEPVNQEITDQAMAVLLDITEGENINEIIATCTIDDRTSTATGIVDGNRIIFDAIEEQITVPFQYGGVELSPTFDMRYDIVCTLTEGQLFLDGSCKGDGAENYGFATITLDMDGTISGSLNKTE